MSVTAGEGSGEEVSGWGSIGIKPGISGTGVSLGDVVSAGEVGAGVTGAATGGGAWFCLGGKKIPCTK